MKFGGFMFRARALRVAIIAALVIRVGLSAESAHADAAEAKKIFTTRCTACHTFGKGVKVGPDLKGVNERRQRPWLLKFIRSSSTVIASNDPIAVELFQQFKQQRMPDWSDLSEEQVNSILDWLAVNGPEQQEPDVRLAETATPAEIDTGRQLFHGTRNLMHGGSACATCHSIRDEVSAGGGTLAPDLTTVFSVYQDVAMTVFLKHPCFMRYPESNSTKFLAPEESFALKAYHRHAALTAQPAAAGVMVAKPAEGTSASPGSGAAAGSAAAASAAKVPRVTWAPPSRGPVIRRSTRISSGLLFLAFPYAALVVLIVGLGIRYTLARRDPKVMSSTAKAAWQLFGGSKAWRIGIVVTTLLHLAIVLAPASVLSWNGSSGKLYLLEGVGLALGVLAFIGWLQMMSRHLSRAMASARTGLGELADSILLSVLCTAIVSGLVSAVIYRWGSSWGAATVGPYMTSLAHGAPATGLIEALPFLVRLHVFAWFAVIALVPFTSVPAILAPGLDRVLLLLARPVNAVAQSGKQLAARFSPARWLWPEEDAIDVAGGEDNAKKPS